MPSTERLIKIIKQYPIFYDHQHPDFRDSVIKDQTWDSVAEQMEEHPHHLKRKWRNLKDTYSRYLRSGETEQTTTKNNRYRGWQWAKQMEFCRPHVKFVRRKRSLPNDTEADLSDTTIIAEQKCDLDDTQSDTPPNIDLTTTVENDRPILHCEINDIGCRKTIPKRKQKLSDYEQSKTDQVMSYLRSRDKHNMDPTELIFLGYAKIVKKFSPRQQAIAKMRFAQVLMEEEMNNLEDRDNGNNNCIVVQNNVNTSWSGSSNCDQPPNLAIDGGEQSLPKPDIS